MIKSLVNVTCSETNKAVPYTGKIIGKIVCINIEDFSSYQIFYEYKKEDDTILISGVKILTDVEINYFHNSIGGDLPASVNWTTDRKNEFYEAFKVEMASTFGITTEQIENI